MTTANTLNLAVARFLGYGATIHPDESSRRLIDEFGADIAAQLEPEVKRLLNELNQLQPDWSKHSLVTAGAWAKKEMHHRHPELDSEALDALEWAFTWWWR